MSSTAITDYHYSNCSNDYESLLNNCSSSASTSPLPNSGNERLSEKRPKSNTVMNKIRRFARSQSQIRHGSRGHDYINSDNLVSKTKDLYRDVKRRFSSFNTNSLDGGSNDGQRSKSSLPTARTSNNLKLACESHVPNLPSSTNIKTTLTCETLQTSTVSRLRRYASDESLPTSESGCGSSVKTSSLSTDSNRSSICTVNDFANEYAVFKGPFIGQGVALTDCTPCPYDKDALVFKKGDLVNIIAKNDSGTWIGMANGKIGHFKFINVEEIASLGNGMRSTCSSFCSASSTTLTSTNGVIGSEGREGKADECDRLGSDHPNTKLDKSSCIDTMNTSVTTMNNNNNINTVGCSLTANSSGFVVSHYEDIIRNLLSSVNIYLDNSLKGLFKLIGLDSYDYLARLKNKGFSSLGSLMNITDASVLEIVGITCPEHQSTILSIASIVRKLTNNANNDSLAIKGSSGVTISAQSFGCNTFDNATNNKPCVVTINKLESELSSLTMNGQSMNDSHRFSTDSQSVPTTPASEASLSFTSNGASSCSSYVQIKQSSSQETSPDNCHDSNGSTVSSNLVPLKNTKNFSTTISVSSSSTANSFGIDNLIGSSSSALRLRKKRDRRSSETCDNIKRAASGNDILDDDLYSRYRYSYDHRKSLDTNALVKKLEHGYETRPTVRSYGDIGSIKMLSSSKSVFDLKYNPDSSSSNLIDNESNHVHGSIHCTKKRLKKFLNPSDQQSQQHRKTISTTSATTTTTTTTTTSTSTPPTNSSIENQADSTRLGINSRPLSSALLEALSNMLQDEYIDLTVEPYSDSSGFCGIPPALVQRYAEELETDVYDIAETLDYIRLCSLLNKAGRQGIPNDFLADSCNGPGTDWANYENVHTWLLSLGLPMYEIQLSDLGYKTLWDIMKLREDDLLACGIINKRHLRSLTTAISALSVNQHKIGRS